MTNEDAWLKREQELLAHIDFHVARYTKLSRRARNAQRYLSVISIICTSILPVTVVSSAANLTAFHIPVEAIAAASVLFTVILSVADGLRRLLAAERVWAQAMMARIALENERENYVDAQIGLAIGSAEWLANYRKSRQAVDAAKSGETSQFFASLIKGGGEQK